MHAVIHSVDGISAENEYASISTGLRLGHIDQVNQINNRLFVANIAFNLCFIEEFKATCL